MELLQNWILTILIFLPTAGAGIVLLARSNRAVRGVALGTTLATFVLSLIVLAIYDWSAPAAYGYGDLTAPGVVQMVQQATWIDAFNIQYKVGIDGLALPLVLLSTFISVLACVASWNVDKLTKPYMALFLFLETGILGTFLALDFFLFYVFFEITLLPMYFLIGIWGGPRRQYAAIKFFLYTLVGSIGLLVTLIGTYLYTRGLQVPGLDLSNGTFDLILLARPDVRAAMGAAGLSVGLAKTFFLLLMFAFFVKLPAAPFHTWLPDAHVEAPTPMSMILAALLLKMGGYGIFRVAYPLFPEAAKALWLVIAIVGVVSIIYGALCAMGQSDFKRLVAYSSVSHMGFVILGAAVMTPAAISGAIFMMVAHGITSAMMFFVVGVVYDRAHHRELSRMGGLATTMPVYTGFSAVACFANLGLPGLAGFVGEFLVIVGTFAAASDASGLIAGGYASRTQLIVLAVAASLGIVLSAAYMLWAVQRVFFGPERAEFKGFAEVDRRELSVLTPLAALCVLLGVLPTVFVFAYTQTTVDAIVKLLE
ncbi:MAG TPA: NADH-quinone oxidoreductase subunit M [Tepidisphaeraceae bacterium]|jgi:NADH-quinone oxidoreductase subunit M|nr:NADH-quinone oxidoreductase subunit M [Tepidisphaeraceae bacterium]